MAIEFIPKPEVEELPAEDKLPLYLSIIFLIISVIIFLFLNSSVKDSRKKLQNLEAKIDSHFTVQIKEKELMVSGWQQKIKDYNLIFGLHKKSSAVFALLEKITHSKVWFSNIRINPEKQILETKGRVHNFRALAEQILIWEQEEMVEKTELSKVNLSKEGDIEFEMKIFLKSKIFEL